MTVLPRSGGGRTASSPASLHRPQCARLGERPIGGAGTGARQATHVDQPANISKTAGGAQQGGGGEGIAAMVVGGGAGLGYAGQVDDGVHTAQRFRESGAAFEVAMRQFDGGGQVRGRTSHQASQGMALRHKTFDQMATDETGPA